MKRRMRPAFVFCSLSLLILAAFPPIQIANSQVFPRGEVLALNPGENYLSSAMIDPTSSFAYFGAYSTQGIVVKVRLSDFTRVGSLVLSGGVGPLASSVIDPTAGFGYFGTACFGTDLAPCTIVVAKVRLSDLTEVGSLTLSQGEGPLEAAVIDSMGGFAYFGTGQHPGTVVKIRLSDFTRNATLTLTPIDCPLESASIDPAVGFAYFGQDCLGSPLPYTGGVVKVRLSNFTRVGNLNLDNSSVVSTSVIDPVAGFAYFGTADTFPGRLVKVRLSDFTEVGSWFLNSGEGTPSSSIIDPAAGFAYFVAVVVVKVRLLDFTRNATLSSSSCCMSSSVIDPAAGSAYFGIYSSPGTVVRLDLGIPLRLASDFSLSNSGNIVMFAGSSASTTITATLKNGTSASVALFCVSSLPPGASCSFSPSSVTPISTGATSVLTISTTPSILPKGIFSGSFSVLVSASPLGSTTIPTDLVMTVIAASPDFSLNAAPLNITVQMGSLGTSTVVMTPTDGFTGTVDLSTPNLAAGISTSFTSSAVSSSKSSTLTVKVDGSVHEGSYIVHVRGTSEPHTHDVDIVVKVVANSSRSPTILGFDRTTFLGFVGGIAALIAIVGSLAVRGARKK